MTSREAADKTCDRTRDDLDDYLTEQLAAPEFRAAYEDATSRSEILRELVARRHSQGLSQRDVASHMQTTQSAVSDLEGGGTDPRLSTLQRYARAVNCRLLTYIHAYDVAPALWRYNPSRVHVAATTVDRSSYRKDLVFAVAARR